MIAESPDFRRGEYVKKGGSKGIINLVKVIPFFGGIVNGAFNLFSTNSIGEAAKRVFLKK